ncbi:Alpha/Beta hydrolase protein [Mycena amicta]|nr:Alpha/Beta hydrolase protein [Mycena amicta]
MPDRRYATSADGTLIYAEAVGSRTNTKPKPVLVFIHGFSMTSIAFDKIFEDEGWSGWGYLIRYDLRGHGRSGKPTTDEAWLSARMAEDFDAVLRAFSVQEEKPYVLGWSLGATFITDILTLHPESESQHYLSGIIYAAALPYMGPTLALVGSPACLALLPGLMQTGDVDAYQEAARGFLGLAYEGFDLDLDSNSESPRERVGSHMHEKEQEAREEEEEEEEYRFALTLLGTSLTQPRSVTIKLLSRTQDPQSLLRAGSRAGGGLPLLILHGTNDRIIQKQAVVDAVRGRWDASKLSVVDLQGAQHFLWLGANGENGKRFREVVIGWVDGHGLNV